MVTKNKMLLAAAGNAGGGGSEPVVDDGLIWHLDAANSTSYSGSGNTWSDLIGSENATLYGSPTHDEDEGGGAFNFVAGSSYAKTGFARTNSAFSVSVWCKPNATQSNAYQHCLVNTFESTSSEWWSLAFHNTSPVPFAAFDNDSAKIELKSTSVSSSVWQMITATRSGGSIKLYRDTTLLESSTGLTTSTITGIEPIWIASRSNGSGGPSETYGGWISDIKFYSKELSSSEVSTNYDALKGRYGL